MRSILNDDCVINISRSESNKEKISYDSMSINEYNKKNYNSNLSNKYPLKSQLSNKSVNPEIKLYGAKDPSKNNFYPTNINNKITKIYPENIEELYNKYKKEVENLDFIQTLVRLKNKQYNTESKNLNNQKESSYPSNMNNNKVVSDSKRKEIVINLYDNSTIDENNIEPEIKEFEIKENRVNIGNNNRLIKSLSYDIETKQKNKINKTSNKLILSDALTHRNANKNNELLNIKNITFVNLSNKEKFNNPKRKKSYNAFKYNQNKYNIMLSSGNDKLTSPNKGIRTIENRISEYKSKTSYIKSDSYSNNFSLKKISKKESDKNHIKVKSSLLIIQNSDINNNSNVYNQDLLIKNNDKLPNKSCISLLKRRSSNESVTEGNKKKKVSFLLNEDESKEKNNILSESDENLEMNNIVPNRKYHSVHKLKRKKKIPHTEIYLFDDDEEEDEDEEEKNAQKVDSNKNNDASKNIVIDKKENNKPVECRINVEHKKANSLNKNDINEISIQDKHQISSSKNNLYFFNDRQKNTGINTKEKKNNEIKDVKFMKYNNTSDLFNKKYSFTKRKNNKNINSNKNN